MAKALRRTISWLELAVSRVGLTQAVRAMSWAYEWSVARESLKHDPSADEVAKWWGEARRTVFREQAAFREAFPELDNPAAIYNSPEALATIKKHARFGDRLEEWGERRRSKETAIAEAGSLPSHLAKP